MFDRSPPEFILLVALVISTICALAEFQAWRDDGFRILNRRGGRWK